jgi:hypothetical protein
MLSTEKRKQRVAELDLVILNSEALIQQTLKKLGITYNQFILVVSGANTQKYLN